MFVAMFFFFPFFGKRVVLKLGTIGVDIFVGFCRCSSINSFFLCLPGKEWLGFLGAMMVWGNPLGSKDRAVASCGWPSVCLCDVLLNIEFSAN